MVLTKKTAAVVGHVGIEVANLGRSKKFYSVLFGGLGFKLNEGEFGIGIFNENFQVWIGESQTQRVRREPPTGEELIVTDHLAVFVESRDAVDAIEREMKKNGFEPLFPCEEHLQFEPGYYAVSFCDPDNYVIEVYTLPASKPL